VVSFIGHSSRSSDRARGGKDGVSAEGVYVFLEGMSGPGKAVQGGVW
jgi:hypothetical protein